MKSKDPANLTHVTVSVRVNGQLISNSGVLDLSLSTHQKWSKSPIKSVIDCAEDLFASIVRHIEINDDLLTKGEIE